MGFWKNIRLAMSPRFDEIIRQYLQGDDVPTKIINQYSQDLALKYSVVFACFRVLAETFATVPIKEYHKLPAGDREETDDTGISRLLTDSPNDEMSPYNYFESIMYAICCGGNSVSLRQYNKFNGLSGLYPLEWQRVRIDREKTTNKLIYIIDNDLQNIKYRNEIFHIPGPSVNGVTGMGILQYAANSISLGTIYEKFGQSFYQNSANPSGIFEAPTYINDKMYSRLKDQIKNEWTGLNNCGVPMLLEGGIKFNKLTITQADAQFIESKQFQVEDFCRFCRMPLHMVGHLLRATFSNIEHQGIEFVTYTMLPHFKRAEDCINNQLLTYEQRKNGYYFEFNIAGLLRGDAQAMANSFAVGRQWGWLSVNDIRRMLNLNRIENGDIYLTPTNMVEAGKQSQQLISVDQNINNVDSETKREIENLMELARR